MGTVPGQQFVRAGVKRRYSPGQLILPFRSGEYRKVLFEAFEKPHRDLLAVVVAESKSSAQDVVAGGV